MISSCKLPDFSSLQKFLFVVALVACVGCDQATDSAQGVPGKAGAAGKGGPGGEEVVVSGKLLTIEPVAWPIVARVQGSLSADEVTTIAAKVFGRIVEVNCDLGDVVKIGEPLIKIDDREYALRVIQAEAQLAQVRAAIGLKTGDPVSGLDPLKAPPVRETKALLVEAQQQVARLKPLFEQRTIVATDLEAALSAEQVADARYNSALNSVREKIALVDVQAAQLDLAKQQLLDTVVEAPLDGTVLNRTVAVGTYIQVGQALLELAKTSVLRYRASVPERFAQKLRVGQRVRLTIAGEQRETTIARISPVLDPLSRSLVFEAEVPNEDNLLRSGMFAQAEIILDEEATAIAIPTSALVRFAGVDKAWRVVDGKVSEAVLQVGREVGGMIEVNEGLSVGDKILLLGAHGRTGKYLGEDEKKPKELVSAKLDAAKSTVAGAKSEANASKGL